MELHELNWMFDQMVPTPEQEDAGLERLLQTERKVTPVKELKKLTAAGIAAALMVLACAAAAVTGIDRQIMDFLNAQPAQEELISPYAVPVEISMKDNGGTLQLRQVLADRYSVVMLMDFTAPEGVDLSGAEGFDRRHGAAWSADLCNFLDSGGAEIESGPHRAEWICLEKNTEERRVTFLYSLHLAEGRTDEADSFRFTASDLRDKEGRPLLSGNWTCVVPIPGDSGWEAAMEEVYWTEGADERVTEVYLSPMTFHVTLNRDVPIDGDMDWSLWEQNWEKSQDEYQNNHAAWLLDHVVLTGKNGKAAALETERCAGDPHKTVLTFSFEELVDPAQFQGGTLTVEGHVISLENLTPIA